LAELLSWTVTVPYRLDRVDAGPSDAAAIAFVRGNRTVEVTVTCSGTTPNAATAIRTK
jgi:hypothetical protein